MLRVQLGFDYMFGVDCVGGSGKLALLWMKETGVEIQNFSRRHINATICSFMTDPPWKFTGFYGHLEASKRSEAWSLLRHIAQLDLDPWVCLGGGSLPAYFGGLWLF